MRGMIFAAGQGQRLLGLTDGMPKALVQVAGRPMIEYPLLLLRHYGIREIIVNLHHFGERIESHLGDGARFGLKISYSKEPDLLDTGGGLLKARHFLENDTFVVINTDVLIDLPLADVLAFHKKNNAIATLVLRPDPQADHYGSIDIDSGGRIERFLQARRPKAGTAGTKLMFTGVQVLEPKTFQHMEMDGVPERFSTTKDLYPAMLLKDEALYGFCFEGYWQDLGTPERIRSAEERLTRNTVRVHYL